MEDRKILMTLVLLVSLVIASCYNDNKDDLYDVIIIPGDGSCEFTTVSYSTDLVPVIDLFCNAACHNATDRRGNVILETYNNVQPYLDDGSFVGSIKYDPAFVAMPPGSKLSQCDIDKIDSWIAAGAPNN